MKALVVGGGSIGRRHLHNLKAIGVEHLGVVEPNPKRCADLTALLDISGFSDVESGLDWLPNFVVIASPTHLHMEQALIAAARGVDLFVEKPLCHTSENLIELSELVARNRLVSLVGCNMRFHPGPAQVEDLLQERFLGRVFFARIYAGSYLPNWRADTDYRDNYATKERTGGGCILDFIHEIDLARWYLGDISQVFCLAGHLSSLEIETEDVAAIVCRHASGAISEIHLDYVQRTYQRGCQIVGERGSISWDFNDAQVRCYDAGTGEWTSHVQPAEWRINEMYVDEMKHFIECLNSRAATALPITEAVEVMRVALAAKESAQKGILVSVQQEAFA